MKLIPARLLLLFVYATLFSVGCDSDSGSDEDTIEGLWSFDTPEGEDEDVRYIRISGSNGTIFDYMGDEFDQGPDCYSIQTFQFEHLSGIRYRFTAEGEDAVEFTLEVDGNDLRITVLGFSETYSRSTRDVSDFTPDCADLNEDSTAPLQRFLKPAR